MNYYLAYHYKRKYIYNLEQQCGLKLIFELKPTHLVWTSGRVLTTYEEVLSFVAESTATEWVITNDLPQLDSRIVL